MNLADLIKLKFPDKKVFVDYVIQDDGQGPYISKWDESLGPKPTQAQLDAWTIELAPVKQAQDARQAKREEYLPIGDQNDAILKQFKMMRDNGIELLPELNAIIDEHDRIKAAHPLEKP